MVKSASRSICAAAAGLIALAGCTDTVETAGDPAIRVGSVVAALVNDEPVYVSDIELEAAAQGLIDAGDVFDETHPDYALVLDQLIDQRLLAQEALRRRLDRAETARHRLEAARERILGNLLVESLVASEVDETAIREMYAEQVRLQQLDDEVRIRHILVEEEATAQEVRRKIENGEDFSTLAFEYSIDRVTRIEGGELGYVSPNALNEPFAAIIGDTAVGSVSAPFQSERGWHVLKVEDRRQKAPLTLEEMRPEIVKFLTFAQISQILRRLRVEADIDRDVGTSSSVADFGFVTEPDLPLESDVEPGPQADEAEAPDPSSDEDTL